MKGGKVTAEVDSIHLALRPVLKLYEHPLVRDFGPLALKACREAMVKLDWSRGFDCAEVGRVKRMFAWGFQ